MNKVILLGRLTRDPEVRYSQSTEPVAVARYTLAVNRRFKRDNEPDADFIPCVAFGKSGEFAGKYFRKGQQVAVEGRIQVRSWDDQSGQKRWQTEVVIENQYFADSKGQGQGQSGQQFAAPQEPYSGQQSARASAEPSQPDGFFAIDESLDDEDLPF